MDSMSISLNGANIATTTPLLAQAVLEMLGRADRAIDIDPRSAKVFIGQASSLLEPLSQAPATSARSLPTGLAPWQEREIIRHVGDHLDQTIRNGDLAEIAGLSVGHFSRRFKGSFGVSPRVYVIRSRIERAKTLMRQTRTSLCQIALDSGFADQAHMSRLFLAIVGNTPTRWRRAQAPDHAA